MSAITPVGNWKKPPVVDVRKQDKQPHRSYEEFIVAECLVKKASVENCPDAAAMLRDGDELWWYNDNKVPLAGSAGYVIIRGGKPIESFPILRY